MPRHARGDSSKFRARAARRDGRAVHAILVRASQYRTAMPARAIDTATIAFGLVSIPVKIYSTSEHSHEIHFHLIHEGCGERLRQQYICPRHDVVVPREDMSKGYELTKGNFVQLEKDELKALEAVASDELAIREFVPASAVDPIYIDRTYYLGPDKGGERAYGLLRDVLRSAGLVGIADYAARGKQYVVMVRPFEDGLVMHQLRYVDEIKSWSEVPLGKLPKSAPAELKLASQIVEQLQHDTFDPTQYADQVKDRVRKLIAQKAKGGEIIAAPEAPKPVVTDLMEALKASLESVGAAKAPVSDRVSVVRDGRGDGGKPARRGHATKRAPRTHATKRAPRTHATARSKSQSRSSRAHGRRAPR